jgi:hypothetical protein
MAIAFDAATDLGNNGGIGALTANHTMGAGSSGLILACYNGDNFGGADDITSDTFNSVALSLLKKITAATGGDRLSYIDGLLAPASGTHAVSITPGSAHLVQSGAVSYTGVKQSGLPDASTTNFSAQGATSLTTSITTTVANCWVVLLEGCYDNGNAPAAGTGATRRVFDATNGGWGIFDSGGPVVSPGSYSMTTTRSTNPFNLAIVHVLVSIAPDTGGAAVTYPQLERGVRGLNRGICLGAY